MSECTQISLETIPLEWIQDERNERTTGEERESDTASTLGVDVQTQVDSAAQRLSSSGTGSLSKTCSFFKSEELVTFLDGLRRAQEE
jgi:hypothetical protein